jgi:hypothetical protein
MQSWTMFAHDCGEHYQHFGERWWVQIHGLPEPIVEVRLTEAPDDAPEEDVYWGWIDDVEYQQRLYGDHSRADGRPAMIWYWKGGFDMQFPYGPAAEVERGKGRIVRLLVEEVASG